MLLGISRSSTIETIETVVTGIKYMITFENDICDTTTASLTSYKEMMYETGTTGSSLTRNSLYDNWAKNNYFKIKYEDNSCTSDNSDIFHSLKYKYGTNSITEEIEWKNYTSATAYGWNDIQWHECKPRTPQEKLKEILNKRQAPLVITSRKSMTPTSDIRESRARETLQRVLGADKFKSFIKKGFVSVRAKSGLIYQIFPAHGITSVYRDGEMVERLCVVLRGSFPPTDSLIMRYLLILNDEKDFRKQAIKHEIIQRKDVEITEDNRPLTEIWKGLKVA